MSLEGIRKPTQVDLRKSHKTTPQTQSREHHGVALPKRSTNLASDVEPNGP